MNREYEDGETVVYYNVGHNWHLMVFKAYKSQYTVDAYRLKYGSREIVADISEIRPLSEINDLIRQDSETVRTTAIAFAVGKELDDIGKSFGIDRIKNDSYVETDYTYRMRLHKFSEEMADAALANAANFGSHESD